ncbi:MAG: Sapep family Mn(2+)-dependent dipeptidase [Dorea sp.]
MRNYEVILNSLVEEYKDEMYKKLADLIKFPTVNDQCTAGANAPYGLANRQALDYAMKMGEELGFEVKDYDGYAATFTWGNEGKEVGVLSHMDVVPAGDGWNTDPFDPVVMDGKMFGRGTIDDKGPMVAAFYAMKAVKESGLPVRNHVKHIIGCNEEEGHNCLKYYLTKEKGPDMGFSPDACFGVIHAEKAILRFKIRKEWDNMNVAGVSVQKIEAGTVVNAVPNLAKVWLKDGEGNVEVKEFHGVTAHAMCPWVGENAIIPMLDYLRTIEFADASVKEYFQTLYDLFEDGWEGKNLGIACEDQLSGKLTMNLGLMKMDEHAGEVQIDIRCPIHSDMQVIAKTVALTCQSKGLIAEVSHECDSLYVPKDSELVQTLLGVYNEMTGRNEVPLTIGGGTYCREVENVVSYGPIFPEEPDLAHQANEYIDLDNMLLAAKIYAQALYELMK